MRTLIVLSTFCSALLWLGCQSDTGTTSPPSSQQAETEEAIRTHWDAFASAWARQDARACASYFAEDGINVPPTSEIKRGRDEIEAFYETLFLSNLACDYRHWSDDVSVSGDQAVERGHFRVDWTRNDSTTWAFEARSLAHWQKKSDGQWRIKTLVFNLPPK